MEKFNHSGVEPRAMSLESLKEITKDFSIELGRGTFGKVYKGLLQNGEEIAVKKLHLMPEHDDGEQIFMRELGNLWKLRHQNIVQLLGYCYEIKHEVVDFCGKLVPAGNIYRCLCFEYMNNGSLDKHLYDEGCGHDWQTRYKIIKGTCEGLKYLHEGLESPMYHLDLKPGNILLDKNMVPKIADFGISKLIHIDQTQTATQTCLGTRGYQPPEYIENNLISNKYDIFSLGVVMIRIITGYAGYHRKYNMSSQEFIDLVHENWRKKLQATSGCVSLEAECHQVRRCVEIALYCVQDNRKERPTIGVVIRWLNQLEHTVEKMAMCLPNQLRNDPSSNLEVLLKHESINEGSSGSSTVGDRSMDNTQNDPAIQQSRGTAYTLKLYMHQIISGSDHNQVNIANLGHPQMFGCTNVHDYPIYDSLGPSAKVVARAQGLHTKTSLEQDDWFHWSNIVFSEERFQGSNFMAIGNQNEIAGEWVIVGGTGVFTFAQGTITICTTEDGGSLNIKEICIGAFCCRGHSTTIETKSQAIEYKRIWYMHQIIDGPNRNQVNIADSLEPEMFGCTNVHDYPIYDSLGSGKKIVARAQGLHSKTSMNNGGSWFHWSKVVFDYERFQGSSFNAIGNQEGEWAIVGGTGEFAFVQGTVSTSRVRESGSSNIKEIRIHAFCYPPTTPVETKPLKNKMIIIGSSNALSNMFSPMANNPQSGPVTPQSLRMYTRILYMHQIISGPDNNQVKIADPRQHNGFAYTNVHDYPIYDSLGPGKKLVARAQGLHTKTSMSYDGWFHWSSVVFTDERFQGSSLKTIGNQEGDWAIIGGTGMFTFAQGTVTTCRIQEKVFSNVKEIRIDALCCTPINGVFP